MKNNIVISVLQTIGILLVVVGHSFYSYSNNCLLHKWIYSFHMPLFIFISGYLLSYSLTNKGTSLSLMTIAERKAFIFKKVKRLLIPYVTVSTLAFFPKILMNEFASRPIELSLGNYLRMLFFPWDNVIVYFWFLPTLFLIFFLVLCCGRNIDNRPVLVIALCLLLYLYNPLNGVTFLNISGVCNYLLFFVIGYYFCCYSLDKIVQMNKYIIFFFAGISSLTFLLLVRTDIWLGHIRGGGLWELLSSLVGILFCISFAHIYVANNWRFLNFLFGSSFTIYLLSWFPQVLSQQVLCSLVRNIPNWAPSILAIISGVFVPYLIYKVISCTRDKRICQFLGSLIGL